MTDPTQTDGSISNGDSAALQAELEKLQTELAAMTETAKRAMADLQNFKRRAEEERGEIQIYANMKLLEALFPALDNFARAFSSIPEDIKSNDWVKGVEAIEGNLMNALKALGLEVIDQTAIPIDPHQHEVIAQIDGPAGQVVQLVEKGYRFNGKTIRPAKVTVGKGTS